MKDLMSFEDYGPKLLLAEDGAEPSGEPAEPVAKVETLADLATKTDEDPPVEEVEATEAKKERPEWLPEQFFDAETGDVKTESLVKSWKDKNDIVKKRSDEISDEQLAERGYMKVPEGAVSDAAEYKMEIPENLVDASKKVLRDHPDLGEDPIVHRFRDFAAKKNLNNEMFNDVINFYIEEAQHLAIPQAEPMVELEKLGTNGQHVLDSTVTFGKTLKAQGMLDDGAYEEYRLCCHTAEGVKMVQAIRDHYGERSIPAQMQQNATNSDSAGVLRGKQAELVRRVQAGEIDSADAQRQSEVLDREYADIYGKGDASSAMNSAG